MNVPNAPYNEKQGNGVNYDRRGITEMFSFYL